MPSNKKKKKKPDDTKVSYPLRVACIDMGSNAIRFLAAEFSEEGVIARTNGDLANNLGNLVSRTLNMTARYAGGQVPEPGTAGPREEHVRAAAGASAAAVDTHVRRYEFHRALEAIFAFSDEVNRYLEGRAPWKVAKEKAPGWEAHVGTTLHTSCEALRTVALLLAAFLPETSGRILQRLGIPEAAASARLPDDAARWGALAPGTSTSKGGPLFPRIDTGADA